MGYIEDHQGKNTEAYKALKGKANEVKDTDFKEEDHISSSEIVQQMVEQAAKKLTKKTKNISRLENLERTFRQMDPSQVSQSDLKNFIDTVKESLQENHLTNSDFAAVYASRSRSKCVLSVCFRDAYACAVSGCSTR